jgi:Rrf2 family transcriptional regulator, cysteine metabolism repressor
MKLLNKTTDYAIRALLQMAKAKEEYLSAAIISKKQAIPYQFLRTILQKLIKNKIIKSREGINGGFSLLVKPNTIKITDIIIIFQGNLQISDCMFRKKLCTNRSTCVLKKEIDRISDILILEFNKITIQSLIDKLEAK